MKRTIVADLDRRTFCKGTAMTLGLAAARFGQADALAFLGQQHEEQVSQHNMLVVGAQTVFLSHLPMFHAGRPVDPAITADGSAFVSPHRFQVILEATFTNGGRNVAGLYVKDRQAHPGTRIYTIEPAVKEPFVLSELFTPASAPLRRSFMAKIFRGHLEQGGEPIAGLDPARVEIKRVVHARQFNPKAAKPERLEYVLFGKGSELFLAHAIFAPPDFDQVFAVAALGRSFTEAEIDRSLRVVFPDRRNVAADRLREGQKVSGMLMAAGDAKGTPIQLQTSAEFYFEEGELLVPATFDPTPEESKNKG